MPPTTAHLITHTHWDREWFLTSPYTSRWIPGLIDRLEQLVAANPGFQFLFDGQTLVIEDLLALDPTYAPRVQRLAALGSLLLGPYYCQPDWQLTGGELLIRNLLYGQQDVQRYGGGSPAGWLVDTFGHIRQSPQIHRLFGLDSVYVWRGVPALEPYFTWCAPDGSRLLALYLVGGYRNLYGVTHAPEVAVRRLHAEVEKLQPFYPTPDVPLFDGYDLEDDPEDPVRFYAEQAGVGPGVVVQASTPAQFAQAVAPRLPRLPELASELNSGKYGATFPGTLSARAYLKVMARDCQHLLFHLCEPLAVLARLKGRPYPAAQFEAWGRLLLQNAVHDAICGVSIDQVHEKMEYSYRQAFDAMQADLRASLAALLHGFAPGAYALSTNAYSLDTWLLIPPQPSTPSSATPSPSVAPSSLAAELPSPSGIGDGGEGELPFPPPSMPDHAPSVSGGFLAHLRTTGVGASPLLERLPVEPVNQAVPDFTWRNDHYTAKVTTLGQVHVAGTQAGEFAVFREHGDTYSDERGECLGVLSLVAPLTLLHRSPRHCALGFSLAWRSGADWVTAGVRLLFDPSPLIQWEIDLESRGADLRVEMVFATGHSGPRHAGMPFDLVPRPAADTDLLPRQPPPDLAGVLLGQRELGAVTTFPFQDFLLIEPGTAADSADAGPNASSSPASAAVIFGRGLHAYSADEAGTVRLPLTRAVEWLTRPDLANRVGDAGPFFYVPDARCERAVTHNLALAVGPFSPGSPSLHALNAAYQNPPLIVHHAGPGTQTSWSVFAEAAPLSSLALQGGQPLVRLYNPTSQPLPLSRLYLQTDVWGREQGPIAALPPYAITTLQLPHPMPPLTLAPLHPGPPAGMSHAVECLNPPAWRVGPNLGTPDPAVLARLEAKIADLTAQVAAAEAALAQANGARRLRRQHRCYVLQRECVELQFSLLLNQRKLARPGPPTHADLYHADPDIAALGLHLNHLRIKRRIFDYIVQSLPD